MTIAGKAVLVTGANRGIGHALVEEALRRGVGRVYMATRQPTTHPDARVTPVMMDVTDRRRIQRVAEGVESVDVLVNNAGVALYDDLSDRDAIEQHLAVNLLGTFDVIQAFLPKLQSSRGAIVNNLSVNTLAPLPLIPAYWISKAAAFNLTQSLRILLAPRGVRVHAVLTGPVDTDMTKGLEITKATSQSVAKEIFDGVDDDQNEIFPDAMSQTLAEGWRTGTAKALEQRYAGMLDAAGAPKALI